MEDEGQSSTVVGFSFGAQLAVLFAAQRPGRVVVVSAQAVPMRATRPTLALLGAMAGLAKNESFARLQARQLFVPEGLLDDYVRTSATMSRETLSDPSRRT